MTDRQTLLLAAGLLCDDAVWRPVAERLADVADVAIVAFAGCGSIGAMADKLLAAREGPIAVAGHSMGGRVVLEASVRAPERITRLALLNTGIHATGPGEPAGRRRLVELAHAEGMAAVAAAWLPPMIGARSSMDEGLIAAMTAMIGRMSPDDFGRQQEALIAKPDAEAALSRVTVPTLLLSATDDGWSPPAQHEAMLARVPQAVLEIVPDAGHMSPMETPDAVAAALRRWLATGNDGSR